jgi:hypothetical protein
VRAVQGAGGYLSVCQAPNGVITLFGSKMGCAAFNEAWLRDGKPFDSLRSLKALSGVEGPVESKPPAPATEKK